MLRTAGTIGLTFFVDTQFFSILIFFKISFFFNFFFPRATPGPSASPKFKKMEKQGKNDKSTLVFASFSDRFLNISSARVKIGHSK